MKKIPYLLLLSLVFLPVFVSSTTYYVDFNNGLDSNSGISAENAWKHVPGDPNAGGNANLVLKPGDTVLFKGGVIYKGFFEVKSSGTASAPITYRGNGWGQDKAIFDHSIQLSGWTKCSSAEECGGNPNWQKIYYATAPMGTKALLSNLYQDDEMLYVAQYPNPVDPFFMDNRDYYLNASTVSSTTLDDPLLSEIGADLLGGYVFISASGNQVLFRKITGYSKSTITFEPVEGPESQYAISNSIHGKVLDKQGEYYLDENTGKVYLWPLQDQNPSQSEITVSVLTHKSRWSQTTIEIGGHDHIVIDGLKLQKGLYRAIKAWEGTTGIVVKNCEIEKYRSDTVSSAVEFYSTDDSVFENNYFSYNARMGGIFVDGGQRVKYIENTLTKLGQQPLIFWRCTDCEIRDNYVYGSTGVHSNGISVYIDCKNILITGNTVLDSNYALTLSELEDITITNNIFIGTLPIAVWNSGGRLARNFTIDHNILLGGKNGNIISLSPSSSVHFTDDIDNFVMKNNILDGQSEGAGSYTYNIYTGTAWNQRLLSSTEKRASIYELFVNPETYDFNPKQDSPACGAGENGSDIGAIPCGTKRAKKGNIRR